MFAVDGSRNRAPSRNMGYRGRPTYEGSLFEMNLLEEAIIDAEERRMRTEMETVDSNTATASRTSGISANEISETFAVQGRLKSPRYYSHHTCRISC